jgi:hypothetical protein
MDTDIIVVKSLDLLRRDPLTLGRTQNSKAVSNSIIVTAGHVPFLCVWRDVYRDFNGKRKDVFSHYSMVAATQLASLLPTELRLEEETMYRPTNDAKSIKQLFKGHYDLRRSYVVHVWHRHGPGLIPSSHEDMDSRNSTIGDLMKRVYYD